MVKFAEQPAEFGLIGVIRFDADFREPIENAELFFAKPLVDDKSVFVFRETGGVCDNLGGVSRANVRRSENDVRRTVIGQGSEPSSECFCLLNAKIRERYIDISNIEVDSSVAGSRSGFARDIARGLAVADDVESFRPYEVLGHVLLTVKSCSASGLV